MKLSIAILFLVFASLVAPVSASVVMFEMGDYAVVLNKDMDITDSSLKIWPMLAGFKSPESRAEFASGSYTLQLRTLLGDASDDAGLIVPGPDIYIWNATLNGKQDMNDNLIYIPESSGNVKIGRMNPINTTLYKGEFNLSDGLKRTPFFVYLSLDKNFRCWIYNPDARESDFLELLQNIDIIAKKDLCKYDRVLWTS